MLGILEQSPAETQALVSPTKLAALQAVEYSQRFAVAYLFDSSIAAHVRALGWTARYVSRDEDDVVRFLCWDNFKKHQDPDKSGVCSLLVHTSVAYGMLYMDDKEHDKQILSTISKSIRKLLPFLPDQELDVLLHRWRYGLAVGDLRCVLRDVTLALMADSRISQVTKRYRDDANTEAQGNRKGILELSRHPRILLAGDAFLGSNFDGCLLSAKAAAVALTSDNGSASSL